MADIHELNITDFVDTGLTTPMARYTFSVEIKYTDGQGIFRTHGPQSYTFPNSLTTMPLAVRRAFAIKMIDAAARVALGVATWEDYQ